MNRAVCRPAGGEGLWQAAQWQAALGSSGQAKEGPSNSQIAPGEVTACGDGRGLPGRWPLRADQVSPGRVGTGDVPGRGWHCGRVRGRVRVCGHGASREWLRFEPVGFLFFKQIIRQLTYSLMLMLYATGKLITCKVCNGLIFSK